MNHQSIPEVHNWIWNSQRFRQTIFVWIIGFHRIFVTY